MRGDHLKTLDRAAYAVAGIVLTGMKLTLDRLVSELAFHRTWSPSIYIAPLGAGGRLDALTAADRTYLATLVALALPFVLLGTWLTLARLRSARWSPWLVLLFFVPLLNLAFFAALCIAPPRAAGSIAAGASTAAWRRWLPSSTLGAALVAAVVVSLAAVAFVALSTRVLVDYGWGVFIALPFAQGLLAVWLAGVARGQVPSFGAAIVLALATLGLSALLLLAFAFEGLICIAMAVPLAVPLAIAGAVAGRAMLALPGNRAGMLVAGVAALPIAALGVAPSPAREAPRYTVVSSVVVEAPPERVWPHVIAFTPLPPPADPVFLAGIAYPQRAHIVGSGVGATRYCEFSTGAFVEPITAWDAPHRLAFDVTHNPPAMRELSPWGAIETAHLSFLVADAGEFRLNALPGGRTELVGTTWYRHHVFPAAYWRMWSDALIHRIHLRVLDHIARLSTADS